MLRSNIPNFLLMLVAILSVSHDRVNGLRHTCGNVPGTGRIASDDNTGGYRLEVRHERLNPFLDLIPNMSYTVEIEQEISNRKIHALELHISYDGHEDKNGSDVNGMKCRDLQTPVSVQWTPNTNLEYCVTLRAIVWENETNGFNISLEICKYQGCRQYYNADNKGMIFSPGFPEKYIDNYKCTYVIYSPNQHQARLQFRAFELEPSYDDRCFDSVLIQTTNSTTTLCSARNSTGLNDLNFHSDDGILFLTFETDYKVVSQGFSAYYYTTDRNNIDGCSYTTTNLTGYIHSPNYPDQYFPMTKCIVKIQLPTRFRITLHVQYLDLDISTRLGECSSNEDYLQIIQSNSSMENERNDFYFCGKKLDHSAEQTIIQSSRSEVSVVFQSYSLHESSGFMIQYSAVESCQNITYQNMTTGNFTSVNFPDKYLNNQDCFMSINLTGSSRILEVKFNYLYTVSHENDACMKAESCEEDYLEIHTDDVTTRLCGHCTREGLPVLFHSFSGFILVRFVTNNHQTRSGYSGQWRLVDTIPSDDLPCTTMSIDTDEQTYDIKWEKKSWSEANIDCVNGGGFLASVSNIFIQLLLEKFIKDSSNCSQHASSFWIGASDRMFEGDYYWANLARLNFTNWFEGWPEYGFNIKQPSDDGLSDEDCVEMRNSFPLPTKGVKDTHSYYWNDRNCLVKNPYICQRSKHGVMPSTSWNSLTTTGVLDITMDSQERIVLNSPHFPRNYDDFTDTTHRISSPNPFHRLYVRFEAFDLEAAESCICDNVTLSSFPDTSPDVTRCGNWNKKIKLMEWTSQSNRVDIRFQTDNSVSASGFQLSVVSREDPVCMDAFRDQYHKLVGDSNIVLLSDDQACFLIVQRATESYSNAKKICASYNASLYHDTTNGQCSIYTKAIQSIYSDYSQEYISIWSAGENKKNVTLCAMTNVRLSGETCLERDYLITYTDCHIPRPFICVKGHTTKDTSHIQKEILRTPEGQLKWPIEGPGHLYGNNVRNEYEIRASKGKRVFIAVKYLDIEYQEECLYDYLSFDGVMGKTTTLCGNRSTIHQNYFLSVKQEIKIVFHTDSSIGGHGFELSWKWINNYECITTVHDNKTDNGSLSSKNYPLPYPDAVQCCKSFEYDSKTRIIVNFININILPNNSNAALVLYIGEQGFALPSVLNTTLPISQRTFISSRNRLKLCLSADSIAENEGFYATYSRSTEKIIRISETIKITPHQESDGAIQSLHFPSSAPRNCQQIIHLTTDIGFNIMLEITNMSLLDSLQNQAYLEIIDTSLGPGNYIVIINMTAADSAAQGLTIIRSHLNSVQVTFSTGSISEQHNLFRATYTIATDGHYLEKTKYIKDGSISHCGNDTCLNGGVCASLDNRYTCECGVNTTGLFCQTFLCDLHPCVHGQCAVRDTGATCECDSNIWGEHCNMTEVQCSKHQCQGHGVCAQSTNNPICICTGQWTGQYCSSKKPIQRVVTTTGEKLLNEPIWIGMIVVLNLIFAFMSMFIVRRRCEKKLKCCKEIKSTENDKSGRGGLNENNYPCLGDMYKHYRYQDNDHELSLEEKEGEERDRKEIESPDINFGNHRAAAKLFASYNQPQTDFAVPVLDNHPSMLDKDSDDSVGGMKGGTLNFCTTYDMDLPCDEIRENEIAEACFDAAVPILKISELGMTSLENSYMCSFKNRSPVHDKRLSDTTQHCYPEIVVMDSTPPYLVGSPVLRGTGSERYVEMQRKVSIENQPQAPFKLLDVSEKRKRFASKLRVERSPFTSESQTVRNSTFNSSTEPLDGCTVAHKSEPHGYTLSDYNRLDPRTCDHKRRERSIGSCEEIYGSGTLENGTNQMSTDQFGSQINICSMTEKSSMEDLSNYACKNGGASDRKLRRMKRRKKGHSHEISSGNIQKPSISKTSSDSNLPYFSKTKHKHRRSRTKTKNDKCQSIQRMLESSMTEDTLSISSSKNYVRKSRSNDLVPNQMARSPCREPNNSDAKVFYGSTVQRRHSYHTKQNDDNVYDPDTMLNTDQSLTYRLEKSENDLPRLPSFTSYKVLEESAASSDVSGLFSTKTNKNGKLKLPLTSDTDTGFSSSSRSLRSPYGGKEDADLCVHSMRKTSKMDSAYQTKQNSDDIIFRTISIRNQDSLPSNARKDINVIVRLQQAAKRLQTLSSSGDSAVHTTISEDDLDDTQRENKKTSEHGKQKEGLEEVSEEYFVSSNTFDNISLRKDLDLKESVYDIELQDFTCV
ncbi:uncharacterized protein LOC117337534 [Pecten maximus]|uniref:uncharacterized protein LOC117337534 n=1 Tax=Pecten maximus TaxID=6579 RepID=UPI0014583611|nr:uncharacterized protein LOC117337534 [Pecten maximus]